MRGIVKGLDLLNCLFSSNQKKPIFPRGHIYQFRPLGKNVPLAENACCVVGLALLGMVCQKGETHSRVSKSLSKQL